jgi:hypothetical protein
MKRNTTIKKKVAKNTRPSAPANLPIVVAEWPRNGNEVLRLTLEHYRGRYRADLRIWFRADDGELRRTRRGVPIALEDVDSVMRGLRKAEETAVELGLAARSKIGPRTIRNNWGHPPA